MYNLHCKHTITKDSLTKMCHILCVRMKQAQPIVVQKTINNSNEIYLLLNFNSSLLFDIVFFFHRIASPHLRRSASWKTNVTSLSKSTAKSQPRIPQETRSPMALPMTTTTTATTNRVCQGPRKDFFHIIVTEILLLGGPLKILNRTESHHPKTTSPTFMKTPTTTATGSSSLIGQRKNPNRTRSMKKKVARIHISSPSRSLLRA